MEESTKALVQEEESKTPRISPNPGGIFSMNTEELQKHNDSIDIQYLENEKDGGSMKGHTHTVHTSSYRSYSTSG